MVPKKEYKALQEDEKEKCRRKQGSTPPYGGRYNIWNFIKYDIFVKFNIELKLHYLNVLKSPCSLKHTSKATHARLEKHG